MYYQLRLSCQLALLHTAHIAKNVGTVARVALTRDLAVVRQAAGEREVQVGGTVGDGRV
jgi:hypothetical protein